MKIMDIEIKPCPFCGSEDIRMGGYSICADCYVECNNCSATISTSVDWEEGMTEREHDAACAPVLAKLWNRRQGNE